MECWAKTILHYSITPFSSDYSARAQGSEVVAVHAEIAAINFLVVLADQRRCSRDPSGRVAEPWDRRELQVLADHGMFHVDKCFARLHLLAVDELANGIDGCDCDA